MAIKTGTNREQFIENNLGLVHSCAHRFKGRGVEYEDLFQAGCVGLVKAYDGFDDERGVKFSTYAVPVILGEIKKIFRDGGTVKVSRKLKELSIKAVRVREEFAKINSREPTVRELADKLGAEEELVIEALCAARPTLSLTAENDEESESRNLDIPIDNNEAELAEYIALNQAIGKLSSYEQNILFFRFHKCKTQAQTAKLLDTSQVQISRIERRIFTKLRSQLDG